MGDVRVLVVDDEMLTRAGLNAVFEGQPDILIVGHASDGIEVRSVLPDVEPDVVLMDIEMGREDGLSLTRWVKENHPSVEVVVLSNYDEDPLVVEAIASGASGYLLKDASRALLCHTVHAVAGGAVLFKKELLERAMRHMQADPDAEALVASLTRREQEILREMARGSSNRGIATELALSESTVKKHVQTILQKLGVDNRTGAVAIAGRTGLLSEQRNPTARRAAAPTRKRRRPSARWR